MLNIENFTKRLKQIIEIQEETASSFAEKVGVQRSSISHILSGRNNPSLEFVLKIIDTYPSVDLYWLLKGKKSVFPPKLAKQQIDTVKKTDAHAMEDDSLTQQVLSNNDENNAEIDLIVIFYKNGQFKNYKTV